MTKPLVLIFAYHFPPENAIGGARPFRFSKYLSRLGYGCRVFTAANQAGRNDPNTEYVPDPFVTRPRHSASWQLERVVRKVILPGDVGIQWSYHACRAARAYIRANPKSFITLFSTFPPFGSHLAGWLLARSERWPWIADCRDPLVGGLTSQQLPIVQERIYSWLERVIARRSDAVIANTDAALLKWQEKFPSSSERFHLIWNGFDSEERIQPLPVESQDCKILSHVGELYHGRDCDLLLVLKSIRRLINCGRLSASNVRVRLVGPAQPDSIVGAEFINGAMSEGWLEHMPYQIPRQDAQRIARSSHGLLLLQTHCGLRVPAKIFEYVQIGRPVLAVVQPNSPSERLLERSGIPYRCVYPGSSAEATDDAIISLFNLPSTPVTPSTWFEEHFSAENQAQMLDAIIRSLHESEVPGMRSSTGSARNPTTTRFDDGMTLRGRILRAVSRFR